MGQREICDLLHVGKVYQLVGLRMVAMGLGEVFRSVQPTSTGVTDAQMADFVALIERTVVPEHAPAMVAAFEALEAPVQALATALENYRAAYDIANHAAYADGGRTSVIE